MEDLWYPIRDTDGRQGSARSLTADPGRMEVRFDSGEHIIVPVSQVKGSADGAFEFGSSFSALLGAAASSELVFPVIAEEVAIGKRKVERERVRVTTRVTSRDEVVDVPLMQEQLGVTRVAVGRVVEKAEAPRQEGDTLIVPVYDEVLVVEKRLVLREEVRLERTRQEHHERKHVTLRREDVQVERTPLESRDKPAS